VTARGGRPRTFPAAILPLAVERRTRTGETWTEIARDLKVNPGTLRARVADYRRICSVHKTPATVLDKQRSTTQSS
jgi:transposase-like protein